MKIAEATIAKAFGFHRTVWVKARAMASVDCWTAGRAAFEQGSLAEFEWRAHANTARFAQET